MFAVCKDSERREQRQTKNGIFKFDYAEPYPIFYKYTKRRVQRQMKTKFSNFGYAQPQPVSYKETQLRAITNTVTYRMGQKFFAFLVIGKSIIFCLGNIIFFCRFAFVMV